MYPPSQAAYDRAITVFSPDGRLFQVEYAREAVKTGATSIGMVCKDAVILLAQKRISSPLIVKGSHEKIYQIDSHVVASSSGLVADARKLVDMARLEAQKHRLTYDQAITTEMLAKKIGDHIQAYTQYGGVRPYGVSLLVAGADGEMRLFETEPSGALSGYKAAAIGAGKKEVEDFFEKEYKANATIDDAIMLAIRALKKTNEQKLRPDNVDIAVITKKTRKFEVLTDADTEKYVGKA